MLGFDGKYKEEETIIRAPIDENKKINGLVGIKSKKYFLKVLVKSGCCRKSDSIST
jgi:hypothetical protein